jgi:hypothetical protein
VDAVLHLKLLLLQAGALGLFGAGQGEVAVDGRQSSFEVLVSLLESVELS